MKGFANKILKFLIVSWTLWKIAYMEFKNQLHPRSLKNS